MGYVIQLKFRISQHIRDIYLMNNFIEYLKAGRVEKDLNGNYVTFIVTKFSDIEKKLLPLFYNYPLQSVKSKDCADFFKVVKLMQDKAHLTVSGLEQIKCIKSQMNTRRKY